MTDDQPKPIPRKSPSDKKRSGPSMREQIAARRKAEVEGKAPAAKAPAKAPAKASAKARAKSTAPAKAKPARTRAAAEEAPSERGKRPSSRTGAARSGGARARAKRGEDDAEGEGSTRTRRARPEKKKASPLPLVVAGVLVVGGGAGAYFSGMFSGQTEAAETPADDTETAKGGDMEGGDGAAGAASVDGASVDGESLDGDAAGDMATGASDAAEDDAAPTKAKPAPSDVTTEELYAQLRALEPFGKPEELSDEEWTTFVEKAALAFEDGGGPSSRAERWLGENGKYAWPALLNEIIKVDPADPVMNPVADRATLVMNTVRGSTSRYGFDYQTASKSKNGEMRDFEIRKNIRLIVALHESWSKVIADPKHWEKIDVSEQAQEAVDAAKAKLKEELSDEDEFGDVEVPVID